MYLSGTCRYHFIFILIDLHYTDFFLLVLRIFSKSCMIRSHACRVYIVMFYVFIILYRLGFSYLFSPSFDNLYQEYCFSPSRNAKIWLNMFSLTYTFHVKWQLCKSFERQEPIVHALQME